MIGNKRHARMIGKRSHGKMIGKRSHGRRRYGKRKDDGRRLRSPNKRKQGGSSQWQHSGR